MSILSGFQRIEPSRFMILGLQNGKYEGKFPFNANPMAILVSLLNVSMAKCQEAAAFGVQLLRLCPLLLFFAMVIVIEPSLG
jgi:hypothetical protein